MSGFRTRHAGSVASRATHSYLGFDPSVGGLPFGTARDGEQQTLPDIAEGAIGTAQIQPGSLTRPLFAETIIPPEVLGALPALPDADYPQGVLVFLTTDEKLYRNTDGSTWSVAVDGADIVANSITAGQIAAGAIGTTELAADAVIANVLNVGGTVEINDTGIIITDGALTLVDLFGSNVVTGAGFGTSWLDFVAGGFYNGHFGAGTTASVVAATEVSGGDSEADYLASLSADIPYWVVSAESGAGTLKRIADSTAVGGFALQWSGTEDATVYQDVPVQPGNSYAIFISWRYTNSASEFLREMGYQFRDSDHGAIGSQVDAGQSYTTSQAAYGVEVFTTSGVAPANARYLRCTLRVSRTSGSPTVWVNGLFVSATQHWGGLRVMQGGIGIFTLPGDANPVTTLAVGGGLSFGTASVASDVYIRRSAAQTLVFDTDGAGAALTLAQVVGPLRVEGLQLGTAAAPPSNVGIAFGADASIDRVSAGVMSAGSNLAIAGYIAPAQITANQNDYNPANLHKGFMVVLSSDAARTITGLNAGVQGEMHLLMNIGSFDITLARESASSSAANRFRAPGAANFTLNQTDSVLVVYDANSTNPRWWIVAA